MPNSSHFTVYTTKLGDVTEVLVADAIKDLAKQLNATFINTIENIYDYDHKNEKVLAGLKTTDVPNGIGVKLENGNLTICGDDYHQVEGFAKLKQMIPEYVKIWKVKQNAKTIKGVFGTTIKIKDKELQLVVNYA